MLRALVELEVRRADDDGRVGAGLGRVRRQPHGLGGGLGAAVDGDLEPAVRGLDEELGGAPPLVLLEQDPFACRPEREDPVEPGGDEEVDERPERVLVEGRSRERRDGGGERAAEQRHERPKGSSRRDLRPPRANAGTRETIGCDPCRRFGSSGTATSSG